MVQPHPIILYDGVCSLCNRFTRFTLERDPEGVFRFAALQSSFARTILIRHGADPDDLDTVYLVTGYGTAEERLLSPARAALFVLSKIGGLYRVCSLFGVLPTSLLNLGYGIVANNRYRLWGKHDACTMPAPKWESRFITMDGP